MYRLFLVLAILGSGNAFFAGKQGYAEPLAPNPLEIRDEAFLTPAQKAIAEKLTSIWEHDTPLIQYGISRNLEDGRGYTAGRARFATGNGEVLRVIRCFDRQHEENHLRKYLRELERLEQLAKNNDEGRSEVRALDRIGDFSFDWSLSDSSHVTRQIFRACQDQLADKLYFEPAMQAVRDYGLSFALSKAVFYDTFIAHGESGAREIADFTQNMTGGTPQAGHNLATEVRWLEIFLAKRKSILNSDPRLQETSGRVVNYEYLLRERNLDLTKAFTTLETSSGYSVYAIEP